MFFDSAPIQKMYNSDDVEYPSQFNCSTLIYVIGIIWVFIFFVLLVIELAFLQYLNLWAFVLAWLIIGIFFLGLVLPLTLIAQSGMDAMTPRIFRPGTTLTIPSPPPQTTRPYDTGSTALYISGGLFIVVTSFVIWHFSKNIGPCCSAFLDAVGANTLAVTNALFAIWLIVMIIMAYTFLRAAFANYYTSKIRKRE